MGTARASVPRFRRVGDAPSVELTEDDAALLRHIHRHRFMRTADLYRLFPARSCDRLSRRLMLLYRAGYLDRPVAQIDRYGAGGSQHMVYGLDNAGARYLADHGIVSDAGTEWHRRNRRYTRENLDHTLAVASFMIDMELACRVRGEMSFLEFDSVLASASPATKELSQPGRWQVELPWQGRRAMVMLAPDGIFGLSKQVEDGRSLRSFYFVEVDRGSMTIAPSASTRRSEAFLYRSSVLRKFLAYAVSHRDGAHQRHFGIPAARILMVTTTPQRAAEMQRVLGELVAPHITLPPELFLFGHMGDIHPFEQTWLTATGSPLTLCG